MMNKKGVSPLIATVVLIAFAVALGVVIMNLGRNLYSKSPHPANLLGTASCANGVLLEMHSELAYSANRFDLTLDNKGTVSIESVIMIVDGSKARTSGPFQAEIPGPIDSGSLITKRMQYDEGTYGTPGRVTFRPKVIIDGKVAACSESDLFVTQIAK